MTEPLRWSIVIVELDPTVGHEQRGRRRALVVSYGRIRAATAHHLGLDLRAPLDGAA